MMPASRGTSATAWHSVQSLVSCSSGTLAGVLIMPASVEPKIVRFRPARCLTPSVLAQAWNRTRFPRYMNAGTTIAYPPGVFGVASAVAMYGVGSPVPLPLRTDSSHFASCCSDGIGMSLSFLNSPQGSFVSRSTDFAEGGDQRGLGATWDPGTAASGGGPCEAAGARAFPATVVPPAARTIPAATAPKNFACAQ